MKKVPKQKGKPKARDPEQFQRFIEAARKRGMNESLALLNQKKGERYRSASI
jgi:hypothetical protein